MQWTIVFFSSWDHPVDERPGLVPEGCLGLYLIDVRHDSEEFLLEGYLPMGQEVDAQVCFDLKSTEQVYRGVGAESPIAEFRNAQGEVVVRLIWDQETGEYRRE